MKATKANITKTLKKADLQQSTTRGGMVRGLPNQSTGFYYSRPLRCTDDNIRIYHNVFPRSDTEKLESQINRSVRVLGNAGFSVSVEGEGIRKHIVVES